MAVLGKVRSPELVVLVESLSEEDEVEEVEAEGGESVIVKAKSKWEEMWKNWVAELSGLSWKLVELVVVLVVERLITAR